MISTLNFMLIFIFSGIILQFADGLNLCDGNGPIDSYSLDFGPQPWNAIKVISKSNTKHYIDISPCTVFNVSNYGKSFIPEVCKNSHICHNITTVNGTKSIGYQLTYVTPEYGTTLATYIGPDCLKGLKYTLEIRFVCGNHLGHPTFPKFHIVNNDCRKILNWETSSACKDQKSTNQIGLNEMKCYVIDDQNKLRDLTPLIRKNGSYSVMSDSGEFHINVCTDISSKCDKDSSACWQKDLGVFESIGSYKWSDIKFVSSNSQTEHEYVELIYRTPNARCKPNNAITKIRFICPSKSENSAFISRQPTLISNLECEYIIQWYTDYACPLEDITKSIDQCEFEGIDLTKLGQTEINFMSDKNNSQSIILNICGEVNKGCNSGTAVCLGTDNKIFKSIGSKNDAKLVKAENELYIQFTSKLSRCMIGNDTKYDRTIIQLECDETALDSKPKFIGYGFTKCEYQIIWRTPIVCPLFEKSFLNCSYIQQNSKGQLIQVDLSSLTLSSSFYRVQQDSHNPTSKYALSTSQEIQFNVCGYMPLSEKLPQECHGASVCLVNNATKSAVSLGKFSKPLTYNEDSKSFELIYDGGYDPNKKSKVSTKIIFICRSFDNQAYLVDFDEKQSQYIIEFYTVSACPKNHGIGNRCVVEDPLTGTIFNLSSLQAENYHVVRTPDQRYKFEINVCKPIIGGSCRQGSAICQKELQGDRRAFSLGSNTDQLVYWNSMLNMTFTGGDPYNDPKRTPRKSQISFLCDPSVGKGHPEFVGENNRSYSFIWYTSLACLGSLPKKTHCVFENETHFIDLNPLSLDRGNHFVVGDDNSIIFINFCRSLNRVRDNQLKNCKSDSAVCMLKNFDLSKPISFGEPFQAPFMGYDGAVHILYNNGDVCPENSSFQLSTDLSLECDKESGQDLKIIVADSELNHSCTKKLIVQTPIACPQKLTETVLDGCIFTDKRTNLSADLSFLGGYKEISTGKKSSKFYLNVCDSVGTPPSNLCSDSTVCLLKPDQTAVSYGRKTKLNVYYDDNLHLRYSGGDHCADSIIARNRSADIELICDPQANPWSQPMLSHYDDCLVKFIWTTPIVCSLKVPSCSLIDESGNYYSLRQLSSLTHSWEVKSSDPDEYYLINVCKPLSSANNCGPSSAVCKCAKNAKGKECQTSLGQVSDHEITIDPETKHLVLTYEENQSRCDKPLRTKIQFRCSNQTGLSGPTFINVNNCTHNFVWNTSFACPHNSLQQTNQLVLNSDFKLHDAQNNLHWDLNDLFKDNYIVSEHRRSNDKVVDKYNYEISLKGSKRGEGKCSIAAICQTKESGFQRDIGSMNNWKFMLDDIALHMTIQSNISKCGRNNKKFVSSKIFFECFDSEEPKIDFLYESDDCEYYFLWKASYVCPMMSENSDVQSYRSSMFGPLILILIIICCLIFFIRRYYSGPNIRNFLCQHMERFRRNPSPNTNDVNFRYQQLAL